MGNEQPYHLVALLIRNKSVIKYGANSDKTHPKFERKYRSSDDLLHSLHAEMNVLRFSKPGDKLIVLRFKEDGSLSMAKPCSHCQKFISECKIAKVFYSDWEGNICSM